MPVFFSFFFACLLLGQMGFFRYSTSTRKCTRADDTPRRDGPSWFSLCSSGFFGTLSPRARHASAVRSERRCALAPLLGLPIASDNVPFWLVPFCSLGVFRCTRHTHTTTNWGDVFFLCPFLFLKLEPTGPAHPHRERCLRWANRDASAMAKVEDGAGREGERPTTASGQTACTRARVAHWVVRVIGPSSHSCHWRGRRHRCWCCCGWGWRRRPGGPTRRRPPRPDRVQCRAQPQPR